MAPLSMAEVPIQQMNDLTLSSTPVGNNAPKRRSRPKKSARPQGKNLDTDRAATEIHSPTNNEKSAPPPHPTTPPRRSARLAEKQTPSKSQIALETNKFYSADRTAKAKLNMMKRPIPSRPYIQAASTRTGPFEHKRQLLVILDLNGTLICKSNNGKSFTARPRLNEFLHYIFKRHKVMIWSSAQSARVHAICQQIMTPEQLNQVVAIWTRDDLRLTPAQFKKHPQVYKQLKWIWDNAAIQETAREEPYSQYNTVMVDDSSEKAASEPFNHIEIKEFKNVEAEHQIDGDALGQILHKVNILSLSTNVSYYMRQTPFTFPVDMKCNWAEIEREMQQEGVGATKP